jgi:hypothetical protein
MGRTRLLIVSAIALLTAGIFAGIGLVFLNPFSKAAPRAEAIRSVRSDGLIQENFIFRTATDSIAATHSGDLPLPPLPQSIALLSEQANRGAFVLLTKIRNERNEIVGFAVESESVLEGSNLVRGVLETRTDWTLVIPSRGSIFLTQIESVGELSKQVMPTVITGGTWKKTVAVITTSGPQPNGAGRIVGGSGEFEGISGEFVEFNQIRRWSVREGIDAVGELRLTYSMPSRERQEPFVAGASY